MPKDKETICKDDMYSGKNDGLTFEKFDDIVISWCREKYGDKYALALWKDELMQLGSLDLKDDLGPLWIRNLLRMDVWHSVSRIATICGRTVEKRQILDQKVATRTKATAAQETILLLGETDFWWSKKTTSKARSGANGLYEKILLRQIRAGEPEGLVERTKHYLLGMPGKDGEMFPPRCNMETKLDKLETERDYLMEMCPKDKRDTYEDGKEHTLVRIILQNIHAEYDAAVKNVKNMMK